MASNFFGGGSIGDFVNSLDLFGNLPEKEKAPSIGENLAASQAAANNAANDQYSQGIAAARASSDVAASNYAKKASIDSQNKLNDTISFKGLQPSISSFSTDTTKRDIFGRSMADVANNRDADNRQRSLFEQQLVSQDRGRQNQQMADAANYQSQQQLVNANNANAQRIAQIQGNAAVTAAGISAQGSVLGSLFGSIGSGSPNYKYWS